MCLVAVTLSFERPILGTLFWTAAALAVRNLAFLLVELSSEHTKAAAKRRGVRAVSLAAPAALLAVPYWLLRADTASPKMVALWVLFWVVFSVGFAVAGSLRRNSAALVVLYILAHVPVFGWFIRRTEFS